MNKQNIQIVYVPIEQLNPAPYNPRKWSTTAQDHLKESIERFGLIDPLIVNGAENRKNVLIGGHFRLKLAKDLQLAEVPVVYVHIPDIEKEKELNLRLYENMAKLFYALLKLLALLKFFTFLGSLICTQY